MTGDWCLGLDDRVDTSDCKIKKNKMIKTTVCLSLDCILDILVRKLEKGMKMVYLG
jgi:hypothetical protein